ncbi:hypothetical protein C8A05DRAFT_17133 [Staphylotrichum tortipilum]|uniref:Extracellular membrane protein CFEM domain-containing protein n=1 Tax=Staphylotrichum tortipilum TaxID=2831512 RepID=A0AAN6RRY0_9PEZI|nr:hypothetical protein C8A05DRAFT_17133 [Staphylotrichum longicolle]
MQLALTHALLLLLPAVTAAANSPHANAPRGLTDKVKGLFGNPVAMVEELSPCMRGCVREGFFELDCALEKNCGCSKEGDGAVGQVWEDETKKCFANTTIEGCGEKEYDEGKVLDICKAITEDKNNATYGTVMRKIVFAVYDDGKTAAKSKEGKGETAAAGNGTEKSGAGAVVGRVGGLQGVASAVLAVVVGCAVAMM